MKNRRIDGFFYGLFMDADVLSESGVVASNPRRAYVDDYALCIGKRATLVPSPGARSYGMVFSLTHDEFEMLYAAPGLEPYRPEAIVAHGMAGGHFPALCYNLVRAPGPEEANPEYAARLREVLGKLGFAADYIASVA